MKICILGSFADVPIGNLAQFLTDEGMEVHLLCFGPPTAPPPIRCQSLGGQTGWGRIRAWSKVRRIVAEIQPDVVHATYLTSYGYLASTLPLEIPIVVSGRGSDVFGAPQHFPWLRPLRLSLVRRALRRADRIHSVATHMTTRLEEMGATPSKLVTFPWGISLEEFPPRIQRKPPTPPFQLLCNRHLEPIYDHDTLLKGVAILAQRAAPFRLRVVGDGYLKPQLEGQSVALGLATMVCFEPRVKPNQVPETLHNADLFVSCSRSDGTAASLLEACAAGCVPVVTDIPANRPWIADGQNGFLFSPGDPHSFADAVERAFKAVDHWPKFKRINRDNVKRLGSFAVGSRKQVEIYQQLAGIKQPHSVSRRAG